ncbi:MAG TPA: MBL fold metallo-hydrolase [Spirochaetia bacterium]|nr:MBL fold metallo-hydrolase [Spirochaetia bacterium]
MSKKGILVSLFLSMCAVPAAGQENFESDVIRTSGGDLKIVFLGHGSVMFQYADKVIQVDPYAKVADYSRLPKADLVLITHEHGDHLDQSALQNARGDNTKVIATETVSKQVIGAIVMHNGDTRVVDGLSIEAIPAYNIVHKRDNGQAFHPKGVGNGYILTVGDTRVYVAGDTENTPEMEAVKDIAVAFLPMNLPYTMTPEMVADAARAIRPKILYPYHFSGTDPSRLAALLKGDPGIEVRIRRME